MSGSPPDAWAGKLGPIPSLFKRKTAREAGTPPTPLPVVLRSPPEQWAYAVRFERVRTDGPVPSGPTAVKVVVKVDRGTVGVGCLTSDQSALIDEEFVESSTVPLDVWLVLPKASGAGPLLVRNASAAGASEATVFDVQCYDLAGSDEPAREPALSEPRAEPRWNRYYGSPGETPLQKYRVRVFDALEEPVVVRWVDGLSFRIVPGDQLSRALFVSGTYEPNTLVALRRLLAPGDVLIDVGANAGLISVVASRWVGASGRVYSLEPSAREHQRLLDNVRLNAARNVHADRLAVSDRAGAALLRIAAGGHGGLNTLGRAFAYDEVETAGLESVETVTLDDFVVREGIGRVAAIKLDVEGAEAAALAGASAVLRDHRPAVVLEVFGRALQANGATVADVEAALLAASYRLFSVDDERAELRPLERLVETDEQNVVALPREQPSAR